MTRAMAIITALCLFHGASASGMAEHCGMMMVITWEMSDHYGMMLAIRQRETDRERQTERDRQTDRQRERERETE